MNFPKREELLLRTVLAFPENNQFLFSLENLTKGFQYRIGLYNLVFKGNGVLLLFALTGSDGGKVGDNLLGVFGLSGSGFSSNQHGLIFTV